MGKKVRTFPYTFKDTGIEVQIKHVSPFLAQEVTRTIEEEHPKPRPPMQKVDYGDGDIREEPNLANPEYMEALEEHNGLIERAVRKLLIKRGVECEVDLEAVRELREFWLDAFGRDLDEPDDKVAYIAHICVGTSEDLNELIQAIMNRSQPTEEAVDSARESFPS